MAKKADLKKILNKGLTGKEAGRLIFHDNWLTDTGRGGFLSEGDTASIKAGMRENKDIVEYNSFVRLYRYVDYTLKDARIVALEAESFLHFMCRTLGKYEDYEKYRAYQWVYPAIVTQKQYDDLSAKQRARKMKEASGLWEIITQLSGVPVEYYATEGEPEPDFQNDERLIRAIKRIQELLKAKKLKPFKLEKWEDFNYTHRLKLPAQPAKEVIDLLERLITGEYYFDEDDALFLTVFKNKDLLKLEETSGMVEEWLDTYHPDFDQETGARPEGMIQSSYVAIVQNPEPHNIDKRGYWIERDIWGKVIRDSAEKDSSHLDIFLKATRERIKGFLGIQSVLEAISKVIEVDFLEDLNQWSDEIRAIVNLYNVLVDSLHGRWEELGLPEMKPIKLGKMRASQKTLKYFRERMALALGDDWWHGANDNFSLEAEDEDPDTLAKEFSEELKEELKKMKEEGIL